MEKWESFTVAMDEYTRGWNQEPLGKREMNCTYGFLTFHKYPNSKTITLYEIYIHQNYRNQGYCRKILEHLVELFLLDPSKDFMIESVLSKPLYDYLLRFQYKNHGFLRTKDGFLLRRRGNRRFPYLGLSGKTKDKILR